MMIQRLDEGSEDFVPRRRVVMMISSDDSDVEDFVPIRDLKNTDDDKNGKIKNKNKRPLAEEKSEFRVERENTESKTSVSSSSPFTQATRRVRQPRPFAEPKFVSSPSRDHSAMNEQGTSDPILDIFDRPVSRLMMEKAQEQIKKQSEFIASMAKYLEKHNKDAEQLQRRREGQEERRAKFLEGITDPAVRRNVMAAHREERRAEREADNRAAEAIERTEKNAPKRRQGNHRLRESQPAQYPGIRGFIRDVRATGEKDDLDKIIDVDKIIEDMPAVSESQRKARISLVEKNRTLRKEIEVLEKRRAARWKKMVQNNSWVDHEDDPEVKSIDKELEEKSRRKVKVWSVLRDRNRLIEAGLDRDRKTKTSRRRHQMNLHRMMRLKQIQKWSITPERALRYPQRRLKKNMII
jgi:hypothetical protein